MQMHDINCVPGSVTYLRTYVFSSILALHPCLFNLFSPSLFFLVMHMKTCRLQHLQLPPALTDAPLLHEHIFPFALPFPIEVKLSFFYIRYHNTRAFSTFNPSGKPCSFNFNPYFLCRTRIEVAFLIFTFNWAT